MRKLQALGALALTAFATTAPAQQMDMAAMMKWGAADLVRYHIVGDYRGQPSIASDGSGLADVVDRVVIDLTWKLSESKLVGAPTFQNTKTTLTNPRDRTPQCLAPVLKGEYEHYELLGIKDGPGGALELSVKKTHPVVEVAQSCTASRKTVAAKSVTRLDQFPVASPVMFGMPLPDSDELRVSKDKKSLITKRDGWTWTFTPEIAKK